jgi:FKBP-type peptidyl-prolyl cis-trans isomerase SlpA
MKTVDLSSSVTVNYTGKLEDGTIFDSSLNPGREPLSATLGQGSLIQGFEKGLIGMSEGETKTINIPFNEAYGDVNPELIAEVTKDRAPEGVQVGQMLQTMTEQGPLNVMVKEIKEETIVIDGNHPLAGKDLTFDLEVISVQ